jgi:hypothetical protein
VSATGFRLPRGLTKQEICEYLGDISPATYDSWHAKGIVPGPMPGTNRYDVRLHDYYLDRLGGIGNSLEPNTSPFERWERENAR